jgi:hypothetical protein
LGWFVLGGGSVFYLPGLANPDPGRSRREGILCVSFLEAVPKEVLGRRLEPLPNASDLPNCPFDRDWGRVVAVGWESILDKNGISGQPLTARSDRFGGSDPNRV